MPTLSLAVPLEFSFAACLRYLSRSTRESLHRVEDGRINKVIDYSGAPLFLTVHAPEPDSLAIDYQTAFPNAEPLVRKYVTDWFDMGRDLRPFYALAKDDPLLGPAVEQHYGLRLIGIPSLFEALCWAIIGQQINLAFAYTLKQRFVQTFGAADEYEGVTYHRFPTAEMVARIKPDQLTALQFSARKAEYVIGVAQAVAEGRLSKEELLGMSTPEAQEMLIRQRGVGAWTAHYVLLKCLQRPDAFPAADVGLHNAIKQGLGLTHKPDLPAVHRYAEPWQGWRGYATFYLWQTLLP
ncbi:MAG: DNA-3-methyladenine glycosylase 2 [Tunicatimonas sp.]